MDHPELFMKELSELPETGGFGRRLRIAQCIFLASNPRQENTEQCHPHTSNKDQRDALLCKFALKVFV